MDQHFTMLGISLVICRNKLGKYLAVLESGDRGWWLPGGLVDPPETFQQAALRETIEEAGIHVKLKGILRMEYNIIQNDNYQRIKAVFYAEPEDENELPKNKADKESICAKWVTIPELLELKNKKPGWRGSELYDWATYIESGGCIMPMSFLDKEGSKLQIAIPFTIKNLNPNNIIEKQIQQQ